VYGLTGEPSAVTHSLAYQAVQENKLEVTDVYSTDGDIEHFGLVLLEDDKHAFPEYRAAPLARSGLDVRVRDTLGELAGRITESDMRTLNGRVLLDKQSFAEVAHEFLMTKGLLHGGGSGSGAAGRWRTLLGYTATHLELTLIALLAAMAIAIPLGVLVYRFQTLARPVLYFVGMLQTIPSIALLAFMVPLFGVGAWPAVIALFLYALLPILRNTATALFGIDPVLRKVAIGMGLTLWQRLRYIELPLAAPTILAGIKTAAVITIGTATLAAFIGAGGLGQPIVVGLETRNPPLVLEGAIPAALLAILTEFAFEGLEKWLIPRHLLQKAAE
jgi:osmoprotectant transport system permease protein